MTTFLSFCALAIAAVLFLAPVAASAHSHPVKLYPMPDSSVSAPAQVSIEFSEALEPKMSKVALTDEAGNVVSKESAVVDSANARHMTLALPALKPTVYTVKWISVALDGHKLAGSYRFTVR